MRSKEDPTEDSCAGTPADKDNKAAAGNVGEAEPSEEELVEMSEDYLRWLLVQTSETDPSPVQPVADLCRNFFFMQIGKPYSEVLCGSRTLKFNINVVANT
jgi:hypothetical protein